MPSSKKFAICNETWQGPEWTFARVCERIAHHGYAGVEIAPFTLRENPAELTETDARTCAREARAAGLEIVGLHWLLVKPAGFHLTTPDDAVRAATVDFAQHLVVRCAEMGGTIMVWGSPKQRNIESTWDEIECVSRAADALREIAETAGRHGITLALEPLARKETNFLTTAEETARLIRLVDHPACRLHLDVKAMSDEGTPIPEIIRAQRDLTVHFHANDPNLLGPGMGEVDFHPIAKALEESQYGGWISVEVFDYSPGPDLIAEKSIRYLREIFRDA